MRTLLWERSSGELLADGSLQCVWHGARFDPRTGAALAGPATDPVASLPVRVVNGGVYVAGAAAYSNGVIFVREDYPFASLPEAARRLLSQ